MKEIKKIDKISLAKITALIYGLVGFVMSLMVAVLTVVGIMRQKNFQGSAMLVILYNLGAGLLLGVLTAVLTALTGFAMGYLLAIIYNWYAGKVGGIKLEIGETAEIKRLEKTEEIAAE